ncbi:MAG TPA: hypothetical protein VFW47_18050 [Phenylobacterium sp.]|nr:hypothetical protein [Phenylobacterium sp.]
METTSTRKDPPPPTSLACAAAGEAPAIRTAVARAPAAPSPKMDATRVIAARW